MMLNFKRVRFEVPLSNWRLRKKKIHGYPLELFQKLITIKKENSFLIYFFK